MSFKIRLFLTASLFISIINFSSSQEFRGAEAANLVKGADYVVKNNKLTFPVFIKFSSGNEFPFSKWKEWMKENFHFTSGIDFLIYGTEKDRLNEIHYRISETYNGFPLSTGNFVIHTKNGKVYCINGYVLTEVDAMGLPVLSEDQARQSALNYVNAARYKWELPFEENLLKRVKRNQDATYYPEGELVYVPVDNHITGKFRLTYRFDVYADEPLSKQDIYVDANNGNILMTRDKLFDANVQGTAHTRYSGVRTITADSVSPGNYVLRETGRGNGIETYNLQTSTTYTNTDFTDNDNDWNNVNPQMDEVATDAHWGAEMTYDYYNIKHNRNSIDSAGFALLSYVHYSTNYVNAFWDGTKMTYGDGNGSGYSPLTALDICGHEISHGLDSFTANLTYYNESGAMNEGFSDIFGTCIEWYAKPSFSTGNWLMGDDIGTPFRDMSNPTAYGDPDTYLGNNWYIGSADNGGVHTNSGVLNFWFYLLTQGDTGTNDLGNSYNVTGLGIDTAGMIAFRTLTVYLQPSSQYYDARLASIQAAVDLYGPCSPQVESVTNAWYAVGVGSIYVPHTVADYTGCPVLFGTPPSDVTFSNISSNAATYFWDFGDGTNSNTMSPVHTFNSTGTFNVKLVAYGGVCGNDSITKSAFVTIAPGNPDSYYMPSTGAGPTITDCSGILYDSGGCSGNYGDNTNSTVTIAPTGATSIIMNFSSFAFEASWDSLFIYDGPNIYSPVIGQYTGYTLPNGGTVTSSTGIVTIKQFSDVAVTYSGFEMHWHCLSPTSAPVALFSANPDITCSGIVQFSDQSINNPMSWHWDFGDGDTSNLQNPLHTYLSSGVYSVKLKSSNTYGTDSLVKQNYITINFPVAPVGTNAIICDSGSINISAIATGAMYWYNSSSGGTMLGTGQNYTTPLITTTTTYYVESDVPLNIPTAKLNNSGGGGYLTNPAQYLIFDVYKTMNINSVDVNADTAGLRVIELRNSSGTVLQYDSVNIPVAGWNTINLNFANVQPGMNYQLGLNSASMARLYRNNSGVNFPYLNYNLMSVTSSSAGQSYYYYFYNWMVDTFTCTSARTPVTVVVNHTAPASVSLFSDFNDTICSGTNVTFSALPVNGGTTPVFHWYHNGLLVQGDSSSTFALSNLANNDSVYCIMMSANSCSTNSSSTSAAMHFVVNQAPVPGMVNAVPNPVCFGIPATLSLSGYTGNIQWQDSSFTATWTDIPGETTSTLFTQALNSNIAYRAHLSVSGCDNFSPADLLVPGPLPGIASVSSDTLCNGDTLVLRVNGWYGSIQWQESPTYSFWADIPGGTFATDTILNFSATSNFRARISFGTCADTSTVPLGVVFVPDPVAAFSYSALQGTVTFTNTSSDGTIYNWDFGDGNNSSLMNPVNTYTSGGVYNVVLQVTNQCGINSVTQSVTVVLSGIAPQFSGNFDAEIFPNPGKGVFTVAFGKELNSYALLNIYDLSGRKVSSKDIKDAKGNKSFSLDLSDLSKGVYHFEIVTGEGVANKMVVVE